MENGVYAVSEKLKLNQDDSVTGLREVLDDYEDVRDEEHVSIYLEWDKICKTNNAVNHHKVVEVLARALKRRSEDTR